ncbi:hypothetical protein O181_084134 [Austropuccinia psidii MF-1]|uniref:Uncharacterized protein n=1 Tax=Austropuccinia psidii MF-1 TaxID=1389203 RepID=A0A9Q3IMD7_9BASI|nr:hypothetical protein [Austropuccinia psidii MF-1]
MMDTEQLKFLILPVLNVWPRVRIVFNTKIPDLQNAIFASLERNHVTIRGCCLLVKRDVARWTSVGGPIPVGGRPIYSSPEVPISRTNTEGVVKVVKRIRRIDDSPTDPDSEGGDELDGEEVQVVPHSVGHPSSNSSTQPLANRFQSQVIPSTPRTFQQILASIPNTIPPPSPSTSHARPALSPTVRSSPVQKSRNSPITTSHQLQQQKRWIVPFGVSCRSSFSKKRMLAYPGYQRRSQCS